MELNKADKIIGTICLIISIPIFLSIYLRNDVYDILGYFSIILGLWAGAYGLRTAFKSIEDKKQQYLTKNPAHQYSESPQEIAWACILFIFLSAVIAAPVILKKNPSFLLPILCLSLAIVTISNIYYGIRNLTKDSRQPFFRVTTWVISIIGTIFFTLVTVKLF
ncbi:hypothetical protein [Janthinobacterium sp.]|uniref:hypothetical protein n=1 Tax=Janthinobacterium sp. TaxID=1871054 RepID=UPI00289C304B|nr:hypothetical protein [Janthinobacterium sp.]